MKKLVLSVFVIVALGVGAYLFYSPAKTVIEEKEMIGEFLGTGKSDQVDLVKLQKDLEALNHKGKEKIEELLNKEKELASKDKDAKKMIENLNAEHGVTEAEFQERYGKLLNEFKNASQAK